MVTETRRTGLPPSTEAVITLFNSTETFSANVFNLPERIKALSETERTLVNKLFEVTVEEKKEGCSRLVIPKKMRPFIIGAFKNGGSEEDAIRSIEEQKVITIQDRHIKSEAVYNPLRKKRPQPAKGESVFQRDIDDPTIKAGCPFCCPEDNTPSDSQIGRLRRGNAQTAPNITKFAKEHTLVLGNHNPYEATEDGFKDQMSLLLDWANMKAQLDPDNRFARFGLNRGYKAAGSRVHDHDQGELRAGSMHFPFAERLNEVAHYYGIFGKGNFFEDLFKAHKALNLGTQVGRAKVISMLVPPKEHGIMLIDDNPSDLKYFSMSEDFIKALWEVQQFMLNEEKVREYNIFILPRPRNPDCPEYWDKYRTIAVLVDRGHSTTPNGDIGYAELSGTAVISYDPLDFGPRLNSFLQNKQRN